MLKEPKGEVRPVSEGTQTKENLPNEIVAVSELLPAVLPLIPVSQTTLFPGMIVPFILPEGKLVRTVDLALEKEGQVGVVLSRNPADRAIATGPNTSLTGLPAEGSVAAGAQPKGDGEKEDFCRLGIAGRILKRINFPDNQVSILVSGLQRFEIVDVVSTEPVNVARVRYLVEHLEKGVELEALLRSALGQFKQLAKDNPLVSEEVKVALVNIDGPGKLTDFMASVLIRDVNDYEAFLKESSVRARLQHLLLLLKKEQDVQAVQKKIQEDINQKIAASQREFYLHEQLKLIQKELGRQTDDRTRLLEKFKKRLEGKTLPVEAKTRLDEELERVGAIAEQSSEYSVSIHYLDWLTSLPWGVRSSDNLELMAARRVLEADHYGLKEAKDRILEFLAVKKLKPAGESPILCFVGPPGTGKTSLGRSIARALGRKFFRFSVGGMRDEAEIKGHRRTYVGAMPGKFIQGLKRVGTQNPVFVIDEVDKIGTGWHSGGDPASALLELLDPEQNKEFLDHYLDIPFDASETLFIATANSTDTIPPALLDRMEVITLHGYTDFEKRKIARRHLLPRQLKKHGLSARSLRLTEPGLSVLIEQYAREAGVRNLERLLGKLARKTAYRVALGRAQAVSIDDSLLIEKWLGPPPFHPDKADQARPAGVATGLAWTSHGGEVLFIESLVVPGKAGLTLTGTLGKVMQESANIAYSLVRERTREHFALGKGFFERNTIHVHVPAGSTPKDGPSAGITLMASLYSLLSGRAIDPKIAMTGEITLTGRILPVGGIQEKLLAARRAGVTTILLPKENEKDLREIDSEIKAGLKIIKVATVNEALHKLFPLSHKRRTSPRLAKVMPKSTKQSGNEARI